MSDSSSTPAEVAAPDLAPLAKQITELDFLAKRIREEDLQHVSKGREAVRHAHAAGVLLLRAKQLVRHGSFMRWVRMNCGVGHRQATSYMEIARSYSDDAKLALVSTLTMRKALLLASKFPMPKKPNGRGGTLCVSNPFEEQAHALREPLPEAENFAKFQRRLEEYLDPQPAAPPAPSWLSERLREFAAHMTWYRPELCSKLEAADLDLITRIAPTMAEWLIALAEVARHEIATRPVQETLPHQHGSDATLRSAA